MSPPCPVPSKAAIHALRGLALGTSCAIGLIVEDRRRRISTLTTALNNKKKLRSSRQYHGAAEAAKFDIEDAIVISGEELHWHYRCDEHENASYHAQLRHPGPASRARDSITTRKPQEITTESPVHEQKMQPPSPRTKNLPASQSFQAVDPIPALRPLSELPILRDSGGWVRRAMTSPTHQPQQKHNLDDLYGLSASTLADITSDDSTLDVYTKLFIGQFSSKTMSGKLDDTWLRVSAALCCQCQSRGFWDDAARIIHAVTRTGAISEDAYYTHKPLHVMEAILEELQTDNGDVAGRRLELATELFLSEFTKKPAGHAQNIERIGKLFITLSLHLNHLHHIHRLYWRVLSQLEKPEEFTAWFIQILHQHHVHKSVIKSFRLNFSKMSPDFARFNDVVYLVLQSVEELRGSKANRVLEALVNACKINSFQPKAEWFVRLLQADWSHHRNLLKSKENFSYLQASQILDKLSNPEQIHQIMVKFSVLAADDGATELYYKQTLAIAPSMAKDVWLNGYLTLAKAKAGDWVAVFDAFTKMKPYRKAQENAYIQSYVAVLKIFAEMHPVTDVEDFIKLYIEEMDMPLHRYLVTLVANKYAELHNPQRFITWLEYCSDQGFAMDPGFTNAVLRNGRSQWKLSFQQLRTLFTEMQKLNPACADKVTARILHSTELEDGHYFAKSAGQKVRSLGLVTNGLPQLSKSANEREVLRAMSEQLARGNPVKTVTIYRRALRVGMPWCSDCFRVAVLATLKQKGDNFGKAIKLIGETHEAGHDVTSAVALFIKAQLSHVRGSFDDVMKSLRDIVTRFESFGMLIDSSILSHAAIVSAQFQQHTQAVNLCKLAMEKMGTSDPCFSYSSMRALLMAYWQTLNLQGLRWVVESLPSSPFTTDKRAFNLLRSTRRHIRRQEQSPHAIQATEILDKAIEEMKKRRHVEAEAGSQLCKETLRIMGDAAARRDGQKAVFTPDCEPSEMPGPIIQVSRVVETCV
ncbi:hypothetical protein BX600DRAFT_446129 [Xylariales sp. PMI_506]|nr:hypothetical protein BX600DRAFT_446129 [Xylariales sp. PMI_506]